MRLIQLGIPFLSIVACVCTPCVIAQIPAEGMNATSPYWHGQTVEPNVSEQDQDLVESPGKSGVDSAIERLGLEEGNQISDASNVTDLPTWLDEVKVGYERGFVIATEKPNELNASSEPFLLRFNGWGQLRQTLFNSEGMSVDANQFQLKRARLVFSGHAFTSDFKYFVQLDGRSSSGDDVRLLDYYLNFDIGHRSLGLDKGKLNFRTGKWKMPFTMARYLSGREFEFTDRSVASTFFDVNRSLAWGLYGQADGIFRRLDWEVAIFNGLVTGGAETGSSGTLDNNFAYSTRLFWYPSGEWGKGQLADLDCHDRPATRVGFGFANSTIDRIGSTEFSRIRVVDSGERLSDLLPMSAREYTVNLWALDAAMKYQGWSLTFEYYFRLINDFRGVDQPDLYDHGHWLQIGKFIVPGKFQLLTRWSRVVGDSGTLGVINQSSDEVSGGFAWYFRDQHAKLVFDATHLDGAPISSAALDIDPGTMGWLYRTQIQFAF